jgi:hypothetical protein
MGGGKALRSLLTALSVLIGLSFIGISTTDFVAKPWVLWVPGLLVILFQILAWCQWEAPFAIGDFLLTVCVGGALGIAAIVIDNLEVFATQIDDAQYQSLLATLQEQQANRDSAIRAKSDAELELRLSRDRLFDLQRTPLPDPDPDFVRFCEQQRLEESFHLDRFGDPFRQDAFPLVPDLRLNPCDALLVTENQLVSWERERLHDAQRRLAAAQAEIDRALAAIETATSSLENPETTAFEIDPAFRNILVSVVFPFFILAGMAFSLGKVTHSIRTPVGAEPEGV